MALTGFAVNGICAADATAAMQQLAIAYPQIVQSSLYSINNISAASAPYFTLSLDEFPLPSGSPTTNSFTLQLLPCDPVVTTSSYFDGMQMGWGIVAAMAAAVCVIQLKRAFFR